MDTSRDSAARTDALRFVLHFLGDIHQPLHTEALDRGGNGIKVCFDSACSKENLHSTWDTVRCHDYPSSSLIPLHFPLPSQPSGPPGKLTCIRLHRP